MQTDSHLHQRLDNLKRHIRNSIVGQDQLVERLFITLLCGGHLLVEGAPGLAKTKAIQTMAQGLMATFQRIQFTPDLLPGDITGTEIYRQQTAEFVFQNGPIFNNIILADEINRAPAKVQSALLEAMAEKQVSVGQTTYPMHPLFMVMATQNPIEQEGTYPLPEAQLDRFMLHVNVAFPSVEEERSILELVEEEQIRSANKEPEKQIEDPLTIDEIFAIRSEILAMPLADSVRQYIVQIINASRHGALYSEDLAKWIEHGASPRATIAIAQAAKAYAWLNNKEVITPLEVQNVAEDALRHRIILSIEAEANGITTSAVVQRLLDLVPAI